MSSFNAEPKTLGQLTTQLSFEIPPFQRGFSWEVEQSLIFFRDILDAMVDENSKDYFIGPIVLVVPEGRNKKFTIVDGQQRIATTFIIYSVIRDVLNENGRKEEYEVLLNRFGGRKEYDLKPALRFRASEIDKEIFELMLSSGFNKDTYSFSEKLKTPAVMVKLVKIESWKRIRKTYLELKKEVDKLFKESNGRDVTKLLEFIDDSVITILVKANSEVDAYMLFETLNAKGVGLTQIDLIKNHTLKILNMTDKEDLDSFKIKWDGLIENYSRYLKRITRYYWISKYGFTKERELFTKVKETIKTAQEVKNLILDLERFSEIYTTIVKPELTVWGDEFIVFYLKNLARLRVTQHIPLLFTFHEEGLDRKKKYIKMMHHIFIRRSIVKKQWNEVEKRLYKLSQNIKSKEYTDFETELDSLDVHDDEVRTSILAFRFKGNPGRTLAKLLLNFVYEEHIRELSPSPRLTLEHILPESKKTNMDDPSIVDLLGNLTLLTPSDNSKVGSDEIKSKMKVYSRSRLLINKKLSKEYCESKWNRETIVHRTKSLCEKIIKNSHF